MLQQMCAYFVPGCNSTKGGAHYLPRPLAFLEQKKACFSVKENNSHINFYKKLSFNCWRAFILDIIPITIVTDFIPLPVRKSVAFAKY